MSLEQKEIKTYQINSKLDELLSLFHNGKYFLCEADEWIANNESDQISGCKEELIELAEELKIDEYDLRDLFYENIYFNISIEQIAVDAIEAYIMYKLSPNSSVEVELKLLDFETVEATIKTNRTLDSILHNGMEAYGDFNYNGHCEEAYGDILKNDFYYILKYLIYYYVACNGGSITPYLKIEDNLDNYWKTPELSDLKTICEKLIKNGYLKVLDV